MNKAQLKPNCGCNHASPDYWCVCWKDGFETADAEECFEKLEKQKKELIERFLKSKVMKNLLFNVNPKSREEYRQAFKKLTLLDKEGEGK